MKKVKCLLCGLFLTFALPLPALAYSSEVILGGENIGIHIETPGVMVIGFYKVNGEYLTSTPEIQLGDFIIKAGDTTVNQISELTKAIETHINENKVSLTVVRNKTPMEITMDLEKVDGVYKTGLYVKDGITGIGTLTYIDPDTKVYGALGHEIIESTSSKLVEVKTGRIFESKVTSIRKSSTGNAGEKNAEFNYNHVYGDVRDNSNHGIFGVYNETTRTETIPVGKKEDVKIGKASIYTVLNGNTKKEYEIEITNINEYSEIKNITFKITDEELLNKTGGIVQGMSGSPIVQDGKIIGAVTHVIVDNPVTGYGIFITSMLENGDKIKEER